MEQKWKSAAKGTGTGRKEWNKDEKGELRKMMQGIDRKDEEKQRRVYSRERKK